MGMPRVKRIEERVQEEEMDEEEQRKRQEGPQ
jgi:hypothetical protein